MLNYDPKLSPTYRWHFIEAACNATFLALDKQIEVMNSAAGRIRLLRAVAASERRTDDYRDITHVLAAALLFRDLLQIGWKIDLSGDKIRLTQCHDEPDVPTAKARIRDSMNFERRESLASPSVMEFVRFMERTRIVDDRPRSIFSLVASGKRLASPLRAAARLTGADRQRKLERTIKPYLQLVDGETRDTYTAHRLMDIWRYFRLTWSTPYRSTPGRNLFYLVRDAGQPCHPVIGIAALGNSVIGLKCRDDAIGWTPEAIAVRLKSAELWGTIAFKEAASAISRMLLRHLESGLAAIDITGIATANSIASPTQESVQAIEAIAAHAAEERYRHLRNEAQATEFPHLGFGEESASQPPPAERESRASSEELFRRKRAAKLATLLRAKLVLQESGIFVEPVNGLLKLLWSDENRSVRSDRGRSTIRNILNANKETKIGSSMMEIIVCGAVPPYNYLLGGKLVAMLLTSPQIGRDYRKRYEAAPSRIASKVAGEAVTRPTELVYLGTTSLYTAGGDKKRLGGAGTAAGGSASKDGTGRVPSSASQYNRVRIPGAVFGREGEIKYECVGITEGYGSVHFSAETRQVLEEMDTLRHGARRINSMFGEGTSPRMRKIRQGISMLGLDDRFLVHGQSRLVYAVKLASNTEEYLSGECDLPRYILPQKHAERVTKEIARHWIRRWLASRVDFGPALERVESFVPRHAAVSNEFKAAEEQDLPLPLE